MAEVLQARVSGDAEHRHECPNSPVAIAMNMTCNHTECPTDQRQRGSDHHVLRKAVRSYEAYGTLQVMVGVRARAKAAAHEYSGMICVCYETVFMGGCEPSRALSVRAVTSRIKYSYHTVLRTVKCAVRVAGSRTEALVVTVNMREWGAGHSLPLMGEAHLWPQSPGPQKLP